MSQISHTSSHCPLQTHFCNKNLIQCVEFMMIHLQEQIILFQLSESCFFYIMISVINFEFLALLAYFPTALKCIWAEETNVFAVTINVWRAEKISCYVIITSSELLVLWDYITLNLKCYLKGFHRFTKPKVFRLLVLSSWRIKVQISSVYLAWLMDK